MIRLLSYLRKKEPKGLLHFSKKFCSSECAPQRVTKHHRFQPPVTYKYQFNNLRNQLDQYINLKHNTLCDNKGARKTAKRLGRGRASHHGKTSGHGHLGQGQRLTKKKWGFEGGQTPIMRRLPKFGRSKLNQNRLDYINLHKIVYFLERGWLSCSEQKYITIKDMVDAGAVKRVKHGLKLLSKGLNDLAKIPYPIFIEANHASKSACEAIQQTGGNLRIKYMTKLKLKEHIRPQYFDLPLRDPLPAKDAVVKLEQYRDWGCEVDYRMPKWVEEELAKGGEYFKPKAKPTLKEIVESTKQRVKPILPKQYNFSF